MATITNPLPDLSSDLLTLYHAHDDFLNTILIFHGPVATTTATNSSRIQATVFTAAGFHSYPRITLSPTSPLYAAVNHLPREKQGDEVCRGLAISTLKYFAELSEPVKNAIVQRVKIRRPSGGIPKMFDEMHAADIANRMEKVENAAEVVRDIQAAYAERKIPWIDIDVTLPAGSIAEPASIEDSEDDQDQADRSLACYGQHASLVRLFGESVFLPTSRLRRAPSQPTNVSRTRQFTPQQKEALRLAMCEVVDTEERYVNKIYELVHIVIGEFRQKSKAMASTSSSPDEEALSQLFPASLDTILEMNMGFLSAIRLSLESTEKEALTDIAATAEGRTHGPSSKKRDPMGANAFARILLEWFPRFSEPYMDYLRSHASFSGVLSSFMKDTTSSFSRRVQETGEQKLRSMLMEPVQRLPRYSLLIDAMTNALPSTHPAVKLLLKARDMITNICAMDSSAQGENAQVLKRLRSMVESWPSTLTPSGRLVAVADVCEIPPPYRLAPSTAPSDTSILLIFQDYLISVTRINAGQLSSRSLLAEIDKPPSSVRSRAESSTLNELAYADARLLSALCLSQSDCGRAIFLTSRTDENDAGHDHLDRANNENTFRAFILGGGYEGKASKFLEEVAKARIASRFPEPLRESVKWSLRSPRHGPSDLGLLAAIFEEDNESYSGGYQRPANVRVVVNKPKGARARILSSSDVDIVASISPMSGGRFKLEIDCSYGSTSTDILAEAEFVPVLIKRLSSFLRMVNQPLNPVLTNAIVHSNFDILRCLVVKVVGQVRTTRSFRPPSPSKMLSNFLSGGQSKDTSSPLKQVVATPVMGEIPRMPPPQFKLHRSDSQAIKSTDTTSCKVILVGPESLEHVDDPLQLLEQTLTAYILALRSRSGNIVGRSLRSRSGADEVAVNELYNILLEDAGRIQAAAEVSVDVLFVAFETFLAQAWQTQMGPVMPSEKLTFIQTKLESLRPSDFEDFFRRMLGEMSPQNRRAFTAIIRLFAELLDASGNDGDRGALTAAFAELLTEDGDPLEYISLLDRLVEDFDRLFDDSTPLGSRTDVIPWEDSQDPHSQSHASKSGSVTSQSSSFRRRFGFGLGLSRENSKLEPESKVSSIIRSLSKSKGTGDSVSQPSSISRGTLLRSRSTDSDPRIASMIRPLSQDGSIMHSTFGSDEHTQRPNSAHNNMSTLSSIGEVPSPERPPLPKKKRRSSLSDVQSIKETSWTPQLSPATLRKPMTPTTSPSRLKSPETPTPSPSKLVSNLASSAVPGRSGSTRIGSPTRTVPLNRKENILSPPSPPKQRSNFPSPPTPTTTRSTVASPSKGHLSERAVNRKSDEVVVSSFSPKKRVDIQTNIPAPKNGVRERAPTAGGPETSPRRAQAASSSPQKTQKLKMQSPQKVCI